MDNQELLLAAQVRKLAAALRQEQRTEDMRDYAPLEDAVRRDRLEAWGNEFPLSSFVPRAYAEIAGVAEQVRALRDGEQGTGKSFWESSTPER